MRQQHALWLERASHPWAASFATIGLPLKLMVSRIERKIVKANEQLAQAKTPNDLEHRGPQVSGLEINKVYSMLVNQWQHSSTIMNHMTSLYGYDYIHFLQPNQYLSGSKPLTERELRVAYDDQSRRMVLVNDVYPLMQVKGKELRNQGVNFVDLSGIFVQERRTLYKDVCCHLNRLGNELLADALIEQLVPIILAKSK